MLGSLSFRSRLTLALLFASLAPLVIYGLVAGLLTATVLSPALRGQADVLFFAMVAVGLIALPIALLASGELLRPLRSVMRSFERVPTGDLSTPMVVPGDDELARLAESHNRLAADFHHRSQQVGRMLEAIGAMSLAEDAQTLALRAERDAVRIFELIDSTVYLGPAAETPARESIPGEPKSLRAELRVGGKVMGALLGRLSATSAWARADQDLFELFASQVAVALRNADLYAHVESQRERLVALAAAKEDFLRGVSHNLQSPLTSIRAHAEQLAQDRPDRRLEIIAEQSDRLSRIVRQLMTVSRLESGAIKASSDVLSLGPRVRKAWEALAAGDVQFTLDDRSDGWLAVADADQLDQVLWAMLDNAVKHGRRTPVFVAIASDVDGSRLRMTVTDSGPGITDADRALLFGRYERGSAASGEGGSGLGLYVSRELTRAMGGEFVLESAVNGRGASFSIYLPAERAVEG
jgi:signal transduction histidine kinase/HAMP domain-containing protein